MVSSFQQISVALMKKIKEIFKYNISIKVKLICSYLILVTIPLTILGAVLYSYFLNAIIMQASEDATQLTNQINKNIESYFEEIDELSLSIAYDETINKTLDELYFNMESENPLDRSDLNDQLSLYLQIKKGVDSIHIYSEDNYFYAFKKGTINEYYIASTQDYLNKAKTTYGKSYIVSRNEKQFVENYFSISIVRPILSLYSFKIIGTLVINVNYNVLKDLIDEVEPNNNSKIIILNEHDQVLYSKDRETIGKGLTQEFYYDKTYDGDFINVYDENNEKYLFISQRSSITSHRIVVIIPYWDLSKNADESNVFIIILAIFLSVAAFLVGILITNTITKPIKELQDEFTYVGKTNYEIRQGVKGKNEISELWLGFNRMVLRIEELIREIISKEDEKRRAEINALQMQINPHFLYNTLNSIKYLSIIQNASNIKRITNLLISLLKELANNQTDYITIEDEIKIVKKYIEIQKVIYLDKFSVSIICPKALYDKKIIKFILQPIVENSIFHGLLPSEKKGQIRIKIIKEEKLKIKIIDNGVGLENKMGWENQSKSGDKNNHIGLNNINNRIKLFYGEEYGITLKSKKNIGTVVEIILPYQTGEDIKNAKCDDC